MKTPLQKADIILVRRKSLINWLVRFVTMSRWGHSVMYIGNNFCIESDVWGVRMFPIGELKNVEHRVYRHKKISPATADAICEDVIDHVGTGYDFRAIWDMLKLFLTGRKANNKSVGNKKKFICSELIAKYYYEAGLPVIKKYKYDEIVPHDFDDSRYFIRID